jgi:hypothetical protein
MIASLWVGLKRLTWILTVSGSIVGASIDAVFRGLKGPGVLRLFALCCWLTARILLNCLEC